MLRAVTSSKTSEQTVKVRDLYAAMETIAPTELAQPWDNVGLLAGDYNSPLAGVLLSIDLTAEVVQEAVLGRFDAVVAYHPPIFKPVASLRVPSAGTEAQVFECIRNRIAVYSPHTALDAAEGGTNDVMAELAGITQAEPLEYSERPSRSECKVVVFVPSADLDAVANAMFEAGAGTIGDYSRCSFRSAGTGTFLGGSETNPTVGERGQYETVDEIRLEVVVPARQLPGVLEAMRKAHSYEEPAFDVYSLKTKPSLGIGRCGPLTEPSTLGDLARRLQSATNAANVQLVGSADQEVRRGIVVAGSAGSLPFKTPLTPADVIITGEIRHHDALAFRRTGCAAIALGHWSSERPVLPALAKRLGPLLPRVSIRISEADRDPFSPLA